MCIRDSFQRLRDRVVRIIFGHSSIFDEFFLAETLFREDIFYMENSFRKSCLLYTSLPSPRAGAFSALGYKYSSASSLWAQYLILSLASAFGTPLKDAKYMTSQHTHGQTLYISVWAV